MKDLQYLFTILYLQNSLCTIDISIPEYQYLSRRLTLEECKRLYVSLHSATFNLVETTENVPDVSCLKLLTKWDKGSGKYEGKTKSHMDVVKRLRQIRRNDLAEWLSTAVFKKLVKDVNAALDAKFNNTTDRVQTKTNKDEQVKEDWNSHDTVMWFIFAGLVTTTVLIICRVVVICCKKRVSTKKAKEEEVMELLSYGSLDSDQETIYECVPKHNKMKQ